MKKITFIKYFSLISLLSSLLVYFLPIRSTNIHVEYFLILQITSIIAFGGMIFHLTKRSKKLKSSFNVSVVLNQYRTKVRKLIIVCKEKTMLIIVTTISFVFIVIFMQYVGNDLLTIIENTKKGSASDFVEMASGVWIIFSFIPTIYFFFVLPLQMVWDRIDDLS